MTVGFAMVGFAACHHSRFVAA
ncbi:hypothetical protein [Glacieibacterium megasporae]